MMVDILCCVGVSVEEKKSCGFQVVEFTAQITRDNLPYDVQQNDEHKHMTWWSMVLHYFLLEN